jgi:purine-binding chemotaxis protein CheW
MENSPKNQMRHFVAFVIDQKQYAISLHTVERVIRAAEVTTLIESPDIILGLINIEKHIIPVINTRHRFDLPPRDIEPEDQFIIANTVNRRVALWVDAIDDILEIADPDIVSSQAILPNILGIEGTIVRDDGMIVIYNLDRLLSLDEEEKLINLMHDHE